VFMPVEKGSPAAGTTDLSGAFTLTTIGRPGVTVGKHQVTVTKVAGPEPGKKFTADDMKKMTGGAPGAKAPEKPKSEIPAKYASGATSGLEATVTQDASKNQFDFTLTD
jgi:hypothetical protein